MSHQIRIQSFRSCVKPPKRSKNLMPMLRSLKAFLVIAPTATPNRTSPVIPVSMQGVENASDKPPDCSPGRFYSLYWRVLPFSWFFLFRDKRLRMRAPFNISFLITEIFGCEFVTKMLKNRL